MTDYTLNNTKKGNSIIVINLPEGELKSQFIRLGITEGSIVRVYERLPGGTVVLQKNRQEIAVGSDLAKKIKVIVQ
ncbi:MAG: ferrous iron transport protein A [Ignavibacteriales bacterium]|jgi:ferrous iron transport protein A|nr:ferrous iron transport protein A [Melioribacteraceae bacterium]RJP57047.1 MAG: ferrous iron transport protein A [Ignavibacteriales bacterium]